MDMVRVKELAETVFANGVVAEKDDLYNRNLRTTTKSLWLSSGGIINPHIKVRKYDGVVNSIEFERCNTAEDFKQAYRDLEEYAIDVVNAKEKK